jgi:HD-like signal output (HDOD) protein
MPRRPNVIPELLRAVNDEDASRRQFSAIISRDPTLTADLLKIANTAFYRVSDQPVESLDRAVAVLGTQGIRSLVSSAALQPVFKVPAGQFTRFPGLAWDHAFLSGVAAESLAALAENEDPFAAQLLALLMGLGVIVAFRLTYDHYSREPGLVPDPEVFATMIDRQAALIARRIAASWELSDRMITALNDQSSAPVVGPALLSRLGRSLWLGRTLGALALLVREGTLSAADARDAALAAGVSERLFDRLWLRLSQQQDG